MAGAEHTGLAIAGCIARARPGEGTWFKPTLAAGLLDKQRTDGANDREALEACRAEAGIEETASH
ncbi:MAG: hypothetical protein RMK32_02845 [Anaerolineae bacterium]|nr:hypothetical protein [Anaerolineae bacterium]